MAKAHVASLWNLVCVLNNLFSYETSQYFWGLQSHKSNFNKLNEVIHVILLYMIPLTFWQFQNILIIISLIVI